jgi:hypothetical protein
MQTEHELKIARLAKYAAEIREWSFESMREAQKIVGQNFFSPESMSYWNSKVHGVYTLKNEVLFVTSETYKSMIGGKDDHGCTIRIFCPATARTENLSRLMAYKTVAAAERVARQIAAGKRSIVDYRLTDKNSMGKC